MPRVDSSNRAVCIVPKHAENLPSGSFALVLGTSDRDWPSDLNWVPNLN